MDILCLGLPIGGMDIISVQPISSRTAALGKNGGMAKFARSDTVFPGLYSDGKI